MRLYSFVHTPEAYTSLHTCCSGCLVADGVMGNADKEMHTIMMAGCSGYRCVVKHMWFRVLAGRSAWAGTLGDKLTTYSSLKQYVMIEWEHTSPLENWEPKGETHVSTDLLHNLSNNGSVCHQECIMGPIFLLGVFTAHPSHISFVAPPPFTTPPLFLSFLVVCEFSRRIVVHTCVPFQTWVFGFTLLQIHLQLIRGEF